MITEVTTTVYDCECDVCRYHWRSLTTPIFCANRDCRSREWNGTKPRKTRQRRHIDMPKPKKVRSYESGEG